MLCWLQCLVHELTDSIKNRKQRRNCDGGWCEQHHSNTLFEREKKNNQFRMWNNIITSDFIWCAPRFRLHISNDFTFHRNSIMNLKHFIGRYFQSFSLCPLNYRQHFWSQLAKWKPNDITTTIWKSLKKLWKLRISSVILSFNNFYWLFIQDFSWSAHPTHALKRVFIMKLGWPLFNFDNFSFTVFLEMLTPLEYLSFFVFFTGIHFIRNEPEFVTDQFTHCIAHEILQKWNEKILFL